MGSTPQGLCCCGITELADIRLDESAEASLMNLDWNDQAVVLFSDVRQYNKNYQKGRDLAGLIASAKLGAVVELPPARNPNSGHDVKVWMWKVSKMKFKRWQEKVREAKPDMYRGRNEYHYIGPGDYIGLGDGW